MSEKTDRIKLLLEKLEQLEQRHQSFGKAVRQLYAEIRKLKETGSVIEDGNENIEESQRIDSAEETQKKDHEAPAIDFSAKTTVTEHSEGIFSEDTEKDETEFTDVSQTQDVTSKISEPESVPAFNNTVSTTPESQFSQPVTPVNTKGNQEQYIGEQIISKIGIVVLVIGIAFGTKYSIENNLLTPLTRIVIGYIISLGLLGFGIKLKAKYKNYSAVLVSGAMAGMYLVTFSAYNFYGLISQEMAFVLMFAFTAFTVLAALNYNEKIIAHIGLVGAYAVPFLLSNNSGKMVVLFSYITIINLGILFISYKKHWKSLYYTSFGFSWIIYLFWFLTSYQQKENFHAALLFSGLFFVIFYLVFTIYKLKKREKYHPTDFVMVVLNALIFYGIGYAILSTHETGQHLLGIFTLANAIIHFGVSFLFYKRQWTDKRLLYLVSGLVLVFIGLAFPVQLDGNWVTLLWIGQAAILFWIGRSKNSLFFERFSYVMMALSVVSLGQDWVNNYPFLNSFYSKATLRPLLNIQFLSNLIFIATTGFICWIQHIRNYQKPLITNNYLYKLMTYAIPAILLLACYFTGLLEIKNYWMEAQNKLSELYKNRQMGSDFSRYGTLWSMNYSLIFLSILSIINIKKVKNQYLGKINLVFNALCVLVFLVFILYILGDLRETYLDEYEGYYTLGLQNLWIRYLCYFFAAALLWISFVYMRQEFMKIKYHKIWNLFIHLFALWVLSSELIHWMRLGGSEVSYKLGLSILWGAYALGLIILGVWKHKSYLRVAGMVLFGVTLIKLFLYDIVHLSTLQKTIIFVSLGAFLLIISFLYFKYKKLILDEQQD